MNIIYHCVGGSHSSVLAAAIHLGLLPDDRKPTKEDILGISFFDTLSKQEQGKILLRGLDENGNKVFTLSRQFAPHLVLPAIEDAYQLGGGQLSDLLLVSTMSPVNWLMKIGGFSSRRLHLVAFGRPIAAYGTAKAYDKIAQLVNNAKKMIN
ncbi:DUF3189 family protein [Proteiniborus sp. MB09-C3]|uniref:DUF3189 family protein n=1 Tax=Proteiniborus sp. MB09-C3 TaxID=3050072 RepID=UPI002556A42B|nr:DUF3189 family protein [Proteiniborus sp. MB09-C3]WIV10730.1 DUF3189 family protein [Proteiniborus sp. MB09-C3]